MNYDDKRLHLILITFGAALMATGCTSSLERHYTKTEALSLGGWSEQGSDLCELEGWYDDGVCDEFCPEPDSDCDATCLAYPSCDADETSFERWEDCPADSSCREVSICGSTIWCAELDSACLAEIFYPSCEDGETLHERWEECPADASCREVTLCGMVYWCSADIAPTCAGPNPAGCVSSGCEEGFVCDSSAGTAPSACGCDPESGTWTCTADVSGGVCVPAGAGA